MTKSSQQQREFYNKLQKNTKLLTVQKKGFIIQNMKGNDKEPVKSEMSARESLWSNTSCESDTEITFEFIL